MDAQADIAVFVFTLTDASESLVSLSNRTESHAAHDRLGVACHAGFRPNSAEMHLPLVLRGAQDSVLALTTCHFSHCKGLNHPSSVPGTRYRGISTLKIISFEKQTLLSHSRDGGFKSG